QSDINNGLITYKETVGNATSDKIGFSVADLAGTISGTFLIPIAALPAIVTGGTLAIATGATGTITTGILNVTDADDGPAQLTYTEVSPPADGTLMKSGTTATKFTQADINAGSITYVETAAVTTQTTDKIAFTVADPNGNLVPGGALLTISISAPVATPKPAQAADIGLTVAVGASGTITTSVLNYTETGAVAPAQLTYTVTSAPADGKVLKSGAAVSTFTQADINAGTITYLENGNPATSDSFAFSVTDQNNNAVTGSFPITITPAVSKPVQGADTGLTVPVSGTGTITTSVLNYTETGATASQLTYAVTSAPADGGVLKSGASVTTFTQADINGGLITYRENGNAATTDSFAFSVTDQNNNAVTGSFPVTITPAVSKPVQGADTGLTVPVSGTGTITTSVLNYTETGATASQLTYAVTSAPADGGVLKSGASVTTFTQADINAGLITYRENGNAATTDSFAFSVTDQNNNAVTGSFPVTITPAVSKPVQVVDAGLTVPVSGTGTITTSVLNYTETGG